MSMKKIATGCAAAFASVWLSTAAIAVPIPADDGILNVGDSDAYQTPSLRRNTNFTENLDFTAAASGVSIDFSKANVFGGAFRNYSFSLINLTTSAVIASNVNLLTGPSNYIYNLINGNNYRIQLVANTSSAGTPSAFSLGFVAVSAVPVPPAAVLLVTGLLGAGYMGRRKSKQKASV
jgi:hypothetical protein